jgi:short subunit dehydrogenase-like uncharacterized protein
MARVNERVVRRTRALLGEPWGAGFRYRERWRRRVGTGRRVGAATRSGRPCWCSGRCAALAARWLPRPGEGPDAAARARLLPQHPRRPHRRRPEPVVVRVASDLDPGYDATAVMLREAALSLALDEARRLRAGADAGGGLRRAARRAARRGRFTSRS